MDCAQDPVQWTVAPSTPVKMARRWPRGIETLSDPSKCDVGRGDVDKRGRGQSPLLVLHLSNPGSCVVQGLRAFGDVDFDRKVRRGLVEVSQTNKVEHESSHEHI